MSRIGSRMARLASVGMARFDLSFGIAGMAGMAVVAAACGVRTS